MPTPKTGEKHKNPTYCERQEPDCCYPVWDRSNNLKKIGLCSLHAAAPELLEAAEKALIQLETIRDYSEHQIDSGIAKINCEKLSAAIAKATGQEAR